MFSLKYKNLSAIKPVNEDWWSKTQRDWAPILLRENRENWLAEVAPNGEPWAPKKPFSSRWKAAVMQTIPDKGGKLLYRTGRMLNSARIFPAGTGFAVMTSNYGVVHQFGTKSIVARPWMGIPDSSLPTLSELSVKNIFFRR